MGSRIKKTYIKSTTAHEGENKNARDKNEREDDYEPANSQTPIGVGVRVKQGQGRVVYSHEYNDELQAQEHTHCCYSDNCDWSCYVVGMKLVDQPEE